MAKIIMTIQETTDYLNNHTAWTWVFDANLGHHWRFRLSNGQRITAVLVPAEPEIRQLTPALRAAQHYFKFFDRIEKDLTE